MILNKLTKMSLDKLTLFCVTGIMVLVFSAVGMLTYVEPKTPLGIILACLWVVGAVTFLSVCFTVFMRRTLNKKHWRILTGEEKED